MGLIHDEEAYRTCEERWSGWKRYIYDCDDESVRVIFFIAVGILIVAASMLAGWAVVRVQDARARRRAGVEAVPTEESDYDGERYRDEPDEILEREKEDGEEALIVL